jgi:hypothetical protein
MKTKQTFEATCPLTGDTRTRKSAHDYACALTVVVTEVKRQVPGSKTIYFVGTHEVPADYTIIRKCGSASKGYACLLEDVPLAERKSETISLISFHQSEALARSAAHALTFGGSREVKAYIAPCTVKAGK